MISIEGRWVLSGALAGTVGGLVAAVATLILVEPHIGAAISFEERGAESGLGGATTDGHVHTATSIAHSHDDAVIPRAIQASAGVFVSLGLYGMAVGILIAIIAYSLGRLFPGLTVRARSLAAVILAYVAGFVVPFVVYPSNPPSIGTESTLVARTLAYYVTLAVSLLAMSAAALIARSLRSRVGWWNAVVLAGSCYLGVVIVTAVLLPTRAALSGGDDVPAGFPAATLADFRLGSMVVGTVLFGVILVALPAIRRRWDRQVKRATVAAVASSATAVH